MHNMLVGDKEYPVCTWDKRRVRGVGEGGGQEGGAGGQCRQDSANSQLIRQQIMQQEASRHQVYNIVFLSNSYTVTMQSFSIRASRELN